MKKIQMKKKQNIKKIFGWTKDWNRHFSKEYIQMVSKHMRRCSTSLVIRERHVKTIMRHHHTPTRMGTIKPTPRKQQA